MLDRRQPLDSDGPHSAVGGAVPEYAAPAWGLRQLRRIVAVALIAAGLVWALARGLNFYGLTPAGLYYDLDQPPLLLVLVGGWLLYRSRRR